MNELGGTDYEKVGKPYDIRVTVKEWLEMRGQGSWMEIDTVELTINESSTAQNSRRSTSS